MAFLDKLADGGRSLIEWIWINIYHRVGSLVSNTASSVFDKLNDIILAPFRAISNVVGTFISSVQHALSVLPAPVAIILLISFAGIAAMGLVWLLKRLYELL